jgi:hypothetical protein
MSHSLSRLWTHLIFSTRDRFPFLKEPELKNDMHQYGLAAKVGEADE